MRPAGRFRFALAPRNIYLHRMEADEGSRPDPRIRIGCAGWSLDTKIQTRFPSQGTHLQRYASVFNAVEINSSFYRPHMPKTYRRWAESVPEDFRFTVKVPKEITHQLRLESFQAPLDRFLDEVAGLGGKLGPLLVQLPPSLGFARDTTAAFLEGLRLRFKGPVAWEPRHAAWFGPGPEALLREFAIARVAADPALLPVAAEPGGWTGLIYRRLHGSPKMYYSAYSPDYLEGLADRMEAGRGRMPIAAIASSTIPPWARPSPMPSASKRLPGASGRLPERREADQGGSGFLVLVAEAQPLSRMRAWT